MAAAAACRCGSSTTACHVPCFLEQTTDSNLSPCRAAPLAAATAASALYACNLAPATTIHSTSSTTELQPVASHTTRPPPPAPCCSITVHCCCPPHQQGQQQAASFLCCCHTCCHRNLPPGPCPAHLNCPSASPQLPRGRTMAPAETTTALSTSTTAAPTAVAPQHLANCPTTCPARSAARPPPPHLCAPAQSPSARCWS